MISSMASFSPTPVTKQVPRTTGTESVKLSFSAPVGTITSGRSTLTLPWTSANLH